MSSRARIYGLVLGLWLLELFFADNAASVRLHALAACLPEDELPAVATVSIASEPVSALVPCLEFDPKRQQMIVAAGFAEGARAGAAVSQGGQFVGLVDAVSLHLCRVKLLGARSLRLPVIVPADEGAGRPPLSGTLVAEGSHLILADAARAERLPLESSVHLMSADGSSGVLLGRISVCGPRPGFELARPELTGPVRIAGVDRASDLAAQYQPIGVKSWRGRLGPDPRWLLRCDTEGLRVASAVLNAAGECVAELESVAGSIALALPFAERERPFAVAVRGDGFAGEALWQGPERGLHWDSDTKPPRRACTVDLFTTAGSGFMPRGLFVGRAAWDGTAFGAVRFAQPQGALVVLQLGDEAALARLRTQP